MTYIPWSSDFALYLEDYLIYEHHLGLWVSMTQSFYLKINIGHCDLYLMVQRFCVTSWRLLEVWTSYFGILPQNKCRCMWLIFHGPVNLSYRYISKTIWCMSVIFSDNEAVWPKFWPQSKYKSTWPILHGLVILLNILKIIWWMNIVELWYNGSVWHIDWPYQVYVGHCPIFYGTVILLRILKTIWLRNGVLGIMNQCGSKIDLVKYMWVSDLYFMVIIDFSLISLS